jgi:hypothetical protein
LSGYDQYVLLHARLLIVAVLAVFTLSACYSLVEPSFRPGDSRDVFRSINRRATTSEPLAGRSACSDPELVANALHLTAATETDAEPRDVYIYGFRTKNWDDSEASVDACEAEYATANPGSVISRIDIPVWRVFGADWSPELIQVLEDAFEEAHDAG